jgi:hypothetical protein
MNMDALNNFRLVGGTSLSLQLGHRISVDIDLFTDADYGSIDFEELDHLFLKTFPIVDMGYGGNQSLGKSYYVGASVENLVKLDLFYTDPFVFDMLQVDDIRLAPLAEIAAMKLEVIANGGRKKDFWDIHELLDRYSLNQMITFYEKRFPYGHSKQALVSQLSNFVQANEDFDPICLRGKHWELIKLDFEDLVGKL